LKPIPNDLGLTLQPSVRIGICPHNYPHTFPMGGKDSIGYRSIDGMLIENKRPKNFGQSF